MKENKITLKETVLLIIGTIKYLLSKWIIIALVSAIFGIINLYRTWTAVPTYKATVSFVLSNNSKTSGLTGLASQFGLDVGMGGASDAFSGDNIIGLISSRRMLTKALFTKYSITDNLINLYARDIAKDQKWNTGYFKNCYPFPDSPEQMNPIQDSLVGEMCELINKHNLVISKPDKRQSIYILETTSADEIFAVNLSNILVQTTTKFYIDTKVQTSSKNLMLIQKEADSLRNLLTGSIANTATEVDKTFNLNPAKQIGRVGVQRSQINVSVFTAAYAEVLKNLEVAKITLQRETPLFQIIDTPNLPLKRIKKSRLMGLMIGTAIGFVLINFILLLQLAYRRLMNQ